jgi:hypothetical protein
MPPWTIPKRIDLSMGDWETRFATTLCPLAASLYFLLPRHFVLVLLEVFLAAGGPAGRHLHRCARASLIGRIFRAFVEGHDDVGTETNLRFHRAFGAEEMR